MVISQFNLGNLNIYLLFLLRPILRFKVILWSFGYDPPTGFHPKSRLKDRIRLYLYEKSDAVIFYWEKGREIVKAASKRSDHYFVAPNTLNTSPLISLKYGFDEIGKVKIKAQLGIQEEYHFVYVGRFIPDKEIDHLLKAFHQIEQKGHDCRLTVIGQGPELNSLKKMARDLGLKKVAFPGEILEESEVGKWIYISDAFVMPGRLGLSVVHAFTFGTPVISQMKDYFFHGDGISYIKNGVNGFLVEDGNVDAFAEHMLRLITDKFLAEKLREAAFETALHDCCIEKMVEGFKNAIAFARDE